MRRLIASGLAVFVVCLLASGSAIGAESCSDLEKPKNPCVRTWKCNGADRAWWPDKVAKAGTECTTPDDHRGTCPGGKVRDDAAPLCVASQYSIGGNVIGLDDGTVRLALKQNGPEQSVTGKGTIPFTFTEKVESGYQYDVKVVDQPTGETCTPQPPNDAGVVNSNIKHVLVKCKR